MLRGEVLPRAEATRAHDLPRPRAASARAVGGRVEARADAVPAHEVPGPLAVEAPRLLLLLDVVLLDDQKRRQHADGAAAERRDDRVDLGELGREVHRVDKVDVRGACRTGGANGGMEGADGP